MQSPPRHARGSPNLDLFGPAEDLGLFLFPLPAARGEQTAVRSIPHELERAARASFLLMVQGERWLNGLTTDARNRKFLFEFDFYWIFLCIVYVPPVIFSSLFISLLIPLIALCCYDCTDLTLLHPPSYRILVRACVRVCVLCLFSWEALARHRPLSITPATLPIRLLA